MTREDRTVPTSHSAVEKDKDEVVSWDGRTRHVLSMSTLHRGGRSTPLACGMAAAWVAMAFAMLGCVSVAKVTNLSQEPCRVSFTRQLSAILTREGEQPESADALTAKTVSTFLTYDLGPRPFAIAAPSGTDYRFFVNRKGSDCVLTLYGRQKGFVSYTNHLTGIAAESLPGCHCTE